MSKRSEALLGEKNPRARLSASDVTDIRLSTKSNSIVARKYFTTPGYIRDIRQGKVWKHVPMPKLKVEIEPDLEMIERRKYIQTAKRNACPRCKRPFSARELKEIEETFKEEARILENNMKRRHYKLSAQENKILEQILTGKLNKEIAYELGISVKTVKYHCTNIYRKYGVVSKIALKEKILGQEVKQDSLVVPTLPMGVKEFVKETREEFDQI